MLQENDSDDYIISTGEEHSLKEFVSSVFNKVGLDWEKNVDIDPKLIRPTDPKHRSGNPSKAKEVLGWEAKHKFDQIIGMLVDAELNKK